MLKIEDLTRETLLFKILLIVKGAKRPLTINNILDSLFEQYNGTATQVINLRYRTKAAINKLQTQKQIKISIAPGTNKQLITLKND